MSTKQPHECTGRAWYEKTRNLIAFNVIDAIKVRRNQHARVYTFLDGSKFIVYSFGCYAYRGTDGKMYARRNG